MGSTSLAYNSEEDAADLDDLRQALGYSEWNVYALSAGGVIGLTAARLYPEGFRSLILDSAIGNRFEMRGGSIWPTKDLILEQVFQGCAEDADCNSPFPNLRARFLRPGPRAPGRASGDRPSRRGRSRARLGRLGCDASRMRGGVRGEGGLALRAREAARRDRLSDLSAVAEAILGVDGPPR